MIRERASEWRSLPNFPRLPDEVGVELVGATQKDGEGASNFRSVDTFEMRRADFAIKLRDYEAYERDLPPFQWSKHRHAFLMAFIDQVMAPKEYFTLARYLPRVVRLATACEDVELIREILKALCVINENIQKRCVLKIAGGSNIRLAKNDFKDYWWKRLNEDLLINITAAFPNKRMKKDKEWNECIRRIEIADKTRLKCENLSKNCKRLFMHDLAQVPFRHIGLLKEMVRAECVPKIKKPMALKKDHGLVRDEITSGITVLSKLIKLDANNVMGFVFATRPYTLMELFLLAEDPFATDLRSIILALRGFLLNEDGRPKRRNDPDGTEILKIVKRSKSHKLTIAVSSYETKESCWDCAAKKRYDLNPKRYKRINDLINWVISRNEKIDYLILPELSLPARWFARTAQKLSNRGISLIAGIEYLHRKGNKVSNQIWSSLRHDGLGFPSVMIYKQDKQRPAIQEFKDLKRIGKVTLEPQVSISESKHWPPILQHGDFRFSILVCSELTNVKYHARLRGKIDALFVPEWNRDVETFNSIVESAALSIHAFVVQCNNRNYGDSRIRAPYKDSWRRDLLRVKGGTHDYCVFMPINVKELREFQSHRHSPKRPFKPIPDGFNISSSRIEVSKKKLAKKARK
jgi:hypothetical protein